MDLTATQQELRRPRLFIIVLNWNGKEDLTECLNSLKTSTYASEVIVVDNGSTDDSVEAVAQLFPDAAIIETGRNLGFGANNVGIARAMQSGADYVLLLNNDTSVDPECFGRLIQVAERNPEAGILSPRICYYSEPDLIWYDGGVLKKVNGFWKHGHINENCSVSAVSSETRTVDYICGCAMLIRRNVIEDIGGLNDRFFMYWEDGEFSLRAKNAGFGLLHVPSAIVLHKVSRSSGGSESPDVLYYMERNRFFFSAKSTGIRYLTGLIKAQIRRCLWNYHDLMKSRNDDQALAVAEAGWDSLIGRSGKRRGRLPSFVIRWLERRRKFKKHTLSS